MRAAPKQIKHQHQGLAGADIPETMSCAAVEEERIAFVQSEYFFFHLVFDIAFENVFAFDEDVIVAEAVVHVFEERSEILLQNDLVEGL
ncbi:MAG TPA: hypothetical protein VGQ51_08195 [Puia sp.]|nr:hypothetical protein [Puia sp.]